MLNQSNAASGSPERAKLADKLFEKSSGNRSRGKGDGWPRSENDSLERTTDRRSAADSRFRSKTDGTHLRRVGITTEQSPLDVGAITEIRRVGLGRGKSEHALNEGLRRFRSLEEELDDGGESLELDLDGLLGVVLKERADELVGIVDLVGVFSQDPDEGRLCFRFV